MLWTKLYNIFAFHQLSIVESYSGSQSTYNFYFFVITCTLIVCSLSLFFMTLTLLSNIGQLLFFFFNQMSFNFGSSDVFLWLYRLQVCILGKNTAEMMLYPQYILSRDSLCWYVFLLMILTLVTWWRWFWQVSPLQS